MILTPETDREQLIAEIAHLQGLQDGVSFVTNFLKQRGLQALELRQAQAPVKEG